MEYPTVVVPAPDAGPGTSVSHVTLLVAVQAQLACVVRVTLPCDALAATVTDPGLTEYVQTMAPACVTVCVWPPIVTVPLRGVVVVFAATA
jgi:hypothetical protein